MKVADGYARNYLLPRKLALPATEGNKKHVERERKIMETREAEEKSQAEAIAARLSAIDIAIARRVGDTEQLYGSVTAADIAEYLKAKGFEIDRRKLILPEADQGDRRARRAAQAAPRGDRAVEGARRQGRRRRRRPSRWRAGSSRPLDATADAGASAANTSRRRNSRRSSSRLIVKCAKTVTADSSHTHRKLNPGISRQEHDRESPFPRCA